MGAPQLGERLLIEQPGAPATPPLEVPLEHQARYEQLREQAAESFAGPYDYCLAAAVLTDYPGGHELDDEAVLKLAGNLSRTHDYISTTPGTVIVRTGYETLHHGSPLSIGVTGADSGLTFRDNTGDNNFHPSYGPSAIIAVDTLFTTGQGVGSTGVIRQGQHASLDFGVPRHWLNPDEGGALPQDAVEHIGRNGVTLVGVPNITGFTEAIAPKELANVDKDNRVSVETYETSEALLILSAFRRLGIALPVSDKTDQLARGAVREIIARQVAAGSGMPLQGYIETNLRPHHIAPRLEAVALTSADAEPIAERAENLISAHRKRCHQALAGLVERHGGNLRVLTTGVTRAILTHQMGVEFEAA